MSGILLLCAGGAGCDVLLLAILLSALEANWGR
jgi:hypothetical protein